MVGSDQNKRGEIPFEAQAGGEKMARGKMEPEQLTLRPSSAGTGVETREQPRLSCREM